LRPRQALLVWASRGPAGVEELTDKAEADQYKSRKNVKNCLQLRALRRWKAEHEKNFSETVSRPLQGWNE
jgi:hypothetical protein